MRATDDRYREERSKFELAMRMIGHEARTGTIRYWTGLSDDRIRKLYSSYFKFGQAPVRRRRGRSPTQIAPLISTPERVLETGALAHLFMSGGLWRADSSDAPMLKHNIGLGHRFCHCFETYCVLVKRPSLSFEWGWNLLLTMRRGDELGIVRCKDCSICYVVDLLALPRPRCPGCQLLTGGSAAAERLN